jgi:hypothetical protein
MPRLLRVHFSSVGHRDARLDGVTLDFRHRGGSGTDSVLWLRNGGGKTSILNLFFSLFRPGRSEFLGARAEGKARRLSDYVKASDLAFVLTEWDLTGSGDPARAPEEVRVIGQVMAWKGQQTSVDPSRLDRLFFSLRAGPSRAFDDLPIRGLGEPVGSLATFHEWLRQTAAAAPAAEVIYTDNQRRWLEHLERLGLDPELFRYQIKMNLREGAADEAFRFGSAAAFVEFLLELAFDPSGADQLVGNLSELREQLSRRPEALLEERFLGAALAVLEPLASAVRTREGARARLRDVLAELASLVRGLDEHRAARLADAAEARAVAQGESEKARLDSNERDKLSRWARGLEHAALRLETNEVAAALREAQDRKKDAERVVRVLRGASMLRDVRRREGEVAELKAALERTELELEPLRALLREAGTLLRASLAEERTRYDEEISSLDAQIDLARTTQRRDEQLTNETVARRAMLEERGAALQLQLTRRDRERERLRADGWFEERESATEALARWEIVQEEADRTSKRCDAERTRHKSRLEEVAARVAAIGVDRAQMEEAARQRTAALESALAWRDRLAAEPALALVEGTDAVDVEAPGLEDRLRRRADAARRQAISHAVDGAEDRRAVSAIDDTGLLPPPRDVERVREALRRRGVVGHAGVSYLSANAPAGRRRALLCGEPARFGGVVVLDERALAAAADLEEDPELRAPVQVSLVTAADLTEPEAPRSATVVAPAAGVHDPSAAQAHRAILERQVSERQREEEELEQQRRSAEHLADDLHRYLAEHGGGKLAALDRLVRELGERIALAIDELAELDRERGELEARVIEIESELAGANALNARSERARERLARFIEDHEGHVETWRAELEETSRGVREAERWLAEAGQARARAEARFLELRDRRRDRARDAETLTAEWRAVLHHDGSVQAGIELVHARMRYQTLLTQHDRQVSENKLTWQLERAVEDLAGAQAAFDGHARDLLLLEIEDALRQGATVDRIASAEAERDRHLAGCAARDAELKDVRRRLEEMTRRREATDLPADRPPPATSAEARAGAEELKVEATRAGEDVRRHELEAAREGERAAGFEREAERLARELEGIQSLVEGAGMTLPASPGGPLPASESELGHRVTELRRRFTSRRNDAATAEAAVRDLADTVRRVAGASEHAGLKSQYRERLKEETEALALAAERLVDGLTERRTIVTTLLRDIERDRRILIDSLIGVADDAQRLFSRAGRASILPDSLGPWAGKHYLRIDFQFPASDDERRARIEPLVDRLIGRSEVGGLELVQLLVTELAGAKGFEVRILKPDTVLRGEPVPITAMTTFSRGQQLTAAILLYCTLVQLRARSRGKQSGTTDAGILVLDNPIGTCSSVPLLQLQRTIASLMRVQLIYATGVDDLEALDTLPNKIRLRNSHRDRTSGDHHVTLEGRIEAVRVMEAASS